MRLQGALGASVEVLLFTHRVLSALLRRVVGLLISARCLLMLDVRGDLVSHLECRPWWRLRGVVVVATSDLLNGFSLVDVECVVMAIVDREWWGGD